MQQRGHHSPEKCHEASREQHTLRSSEHELSPTLPAMNIYYHSHVYVYIPTYSAQNSTLKLFSLGFLLISTLKVSYTSCRVQWVCISGVYVYIYKCSLVPRLSPSRVYIDFLTFEPVERSINNYACAEEGAGGRGYTKCMSDKPTTQTSSPFTTLAMSLWY